MVWSTNHDILHYIIVPSLLVFSSLLQNHKHY